MPKKAEMGPKLRNIQTRLVDAERGEFEEALKDPKSFLRKAGVDVPEGAKVKAHALPQEED